MRCISVEAGIIETVGRLSDIILDTLQWKGSIMKTPGQIMDCAGILVQGSLANAVLNTNTIQKPIDSTTLRQSLHLDLNLGRCSVRFDRQ